MGYHLTALISNADSAVTPKILNINEPMIVPTPISESVTNVLITLVNSSGIAVAVAMKTAAPTSFGSFAYNQRMKNLIRTMTNTIYKHTCE